MYVLLCMAASMTTPTREILCCMELLYKHIVVKVLDDLNHGSCGRQGIAPRA